MSLPAVLGCWTFGAVIVTVIIISLVLKSNYEKEQKKLAEKK